MPPVEFEPTISAGERPQTAALGFGYIGARSGTTQQSGQTPDKEVKIKKNITIYVSGYTEADTTGMLSLSTAWPFSVAVDINSNVFDFYFLIWSLSRLLCCVGSGFNVATVLRPCGQWDRPSFNSTRQKFTVDWSTFIPHDEKKT